MSGRTAALVSSGFGTHAGGFEGDDMVTGSSWGNGSGSLMDSLQEEVRSQL